MAPTRLPPGTRWSLDRSTDPGGLFFFQMQTMARKRGLAVGMLFVCLTLSITAEDVALSESVGDLAG